MLTRCYLPQWDFKAEVLCKPHSWLRKQRLKAVDSLRGRTNPPGQTSDCSWSEEEKTSSRGGWQEERSLCNQDGFMLEQATEASGSNSTQGSGCSRHHFSASKKTARTFVLGHLKVQAAVWV